MKFNTRRTYNKLSPEKLSELRELWETGHHTLDELATRFGMSRRGVQAAMARVGAVKGSKPPSMTPTTAPAVTLSPAPEMTYEERAEFARSAAWSVAEELENMALANARACMARGPSVSTGRAIDLAASVASRAKALRWAALGADGKLPIDAESLPELPIREMTPEEVAEIRAAQQREAHMTLGIADDDLGGYEGEENDIIEEGMDEAPPPPRVGGDDGPMARY